MSHLLIDRRKLLIGTGAAFVISATGWRLAGAAAQTNFPQPWHPIPFDRTTAIGEIESRNGLRRVARLPLLDVEKELKRMESAHPTPLTQWCAANPDIVQKTKAEVYRNPDWVPTGRCHACFMLALWTNAYAGSSIG